MPNPKLRKSNKAQRFHSPALQYVYDRYVGDDPRQQAVFEEYLVNADVARQIHELRTKAGLSQRDLAKLVGTTASVICQLERADYRGHSLTMLRRIAAVLNQRIEIRFVPTGSPVRVR